MQVAHSTGKTARTKEKRKAKLYEQTKAEAIQKKKRRKQRFKLHIVALVLTLGLFALTLPWYISLIPATIHFLLAGWVFAVEFYVKRNKERAYRAYLLKYGVAGKDGYLVIPPHVRMTHKKLIEQGKSIAV